MQFRAAARASLASTFFGMHAAGILQPERGSNITDSGSHFYEVYECADGKWLSVAALESKFYSELLRLLDIDAAELGPQLDRDSWPAAKQQLATKFKTRTRDAWAAHFAGSDACVAPVLDWTEAAGHPQLAARSTFIDIDGIRQPAPAPRFSRTVPDVPTAPAEPTRANTTAALETWCTRDQLDAWRAAGVID